MPLTRSAADAFGVVTICLVSLSVLFGSLCILYLFYFRSRIQTQGFLQLSYFNGPWIIRITLILLAIWWGFGEIVRLSLLKGNGRVLHALSPKWQEGICKFYILSNLGFAEPSMFLTLVLLLHASLQKRELGTISLKWNIKTAGYIVFFCLPMFIAQLVLILIGPKFNDEEENHKRKNLKYFTSTSAPFAGYSNIAVCTYPLMSTILLGIFLTFLSGYLLYLGMRLVSLVINKGLQRRVYLLIISVVGFLPLRIMFLGFTVRARPGEFAFECFVFLAFLMLFSFMIVGIWMLVYCPVVDSLALRGPWQLEIESGGPMLGDPDTTSLTANQSLTQPASTISVGRNSDASTKHGSISLRTMIIKDDVSAGGFEEQIFFSSSGHQLCSPPGSPQLPGRPMIPLRVVSKF